MKQQNVRQRKQSAGTSAYSQSGHSQGNRKQARRMQKRAPVRRKRRRRRRRINWKWLVLILCVAALLGGLGYLETIIFQTKQITVTGNAHTPEQDIQDWIKGDKYAENALYVFWKYNQKDVELPPSIQSVKVSLQSPRKVHVQVTEKTFAGRIGYNEEFLYFDENGTASLKTAELIEGVTYIEGMEIDTEQVKMGEKIPAVNSEIFGQITELTALLQKNSLTPDKVICSESELTVTFGGVQVLLGSANYKEKVAQISPILQKLSEQYAGQSGILHLENYKSSDASIRFVPNTQ